MSRSPLDTIAALSSGSLPSGVAVLRLSGPAVRAALGALAGSVPEPRRASLRRLRDAGGGMIDRGLVLFFPGPASATGEDVAEFHLHGGRAVVAACLAALAALPGIRLAEAGEFTRRAFENGRIDLTEAEGLADLLAAETEGQRRQAMLQSGGALRALYEGWMHRLTHARAMIEAGFDFADEGDVAEGVGEGVASEIGQLRGEMRDHLGGARRGEILREGFRVAIVGAPNAGKSSLLNALADREVAIVSDRPGTTRDVIEVRLDLAGIPVLLSDTAGLREAADAVEAIGVERARQTMRAADLVLLLVDPSEPAAGPASRVERSGGDPTGWPSPGDADRSVPVLTIATKSDRWPAGALAPPLLRAQRADLAISSRTGAGLSRLAERVAVLAAAAAGNPADLVPVRLRHRLILADAIDTLGELGDADHPPEIVAEILRRASDQLAALTGSAGVEDLLDVIFSEFCIGK